MKRILLVALGVAITSTVATADVFKWADLTDECLARRGYPQCFVAENKQVYCNDTSVGQACSDEANAALKPKRLDRNARRNEGPRSEAPPRLRRPDSRGDGEE